MRKKFTGTVLAAVVVLGMGVMVGAQQGPPPSPDGFAHRGPEGHGRPGGMMGEQRPCAPTTASPCPEYTVTVTITSNSPVLVTGSPSTVTNTTTGTLASDKLGDTYQEMSLSGMGAWASQGGTGEFIHVRNLSTKMDYLVRVGKSQGTYVASPIHFFTPPGNWQGREPKNGGESNNRPKPTEQSYTSPDKTLICPDAELTSISDTIQIRLAGTTGTTAATITENRVYCPELRLVVEEDHSDPRFGTRTKVMSNFVAGAPDAKLFLPPFNLDPAPTLSQRKFGFGGRPGRGSNQPPTTP